MMSCTLWHAMVSANVGYMYRNIVNKYYDISVDDYVPRARALGDFSMRGQESVESAIKSSAAFCLSFLNTATVPAIPYLERYYNCDCTKEDVAFGAISTEHSVMCSNYAVDGDEISFIRRLLTEIYPDQSFSMVSDSYDYWNLITNILPQLKKEITEHRGTLLIRGDSGNPVDIICGTLRGSDYMTIYYMTEEGLESYFRKYAQENYPWDGTSKTRYRVRIGDYLYTINCYHEWDNEDNYYCSNVDEIEITKIVITPEMKGTIELLWERFGGTINTKGYKVLDPCIKAIYGDSITPQRLEEIYERATEKKFACNNVILGVGSFSMQCLEETVLYNADPLVKLNPYTRDTYGIAVKATYAEDADGKPIMIFKNPKTDTGNFKKSQRGCCKVIKTDDGYTYEDGLTFAEHNTDDNCLIPVFRDGKMIKEYTLNDIRQKLWKDKF